MGRFIDPAHWVGLVPNGLGEVKPNHYWEMVKVAWENRDQLPYAWRILSQGVCDGCALGTSGMRDFTMEGVHLCTVRLQMLRLNTMPALDPSFLADATAASAMRGQELRALGRLPVPMIRRKGDAGFRRATWDEALDTIAGTLRVTPPSRMAFYLTSRGLTNEVYYAAQKVARFLGTNNVDNSARICHSPSTVALKRSLGVAASTCSYSDWIGSDLIVFFGADTPNNQPVTTKYLYYAKKAGTRVAVVNPVREPGLARYWVPSVWESAIFGTRLADEFFPVHAGGDVAFISGVLKALIAAGAVDERFVRERTTGFPALRAHVEGIDWADLESASGSTRASMERLAQMYASARTAVFVWSMGLTQHRFGVDNVLSVANLALARGMVGRERCGLMPIRGHSGVQGGSEVGAAPWSYPGGEPVGDDGARRLESLWGFPVPRERGMSAVGMIDAAHDGALDVLYCAGGNFLETLPEPQHVREALERVPLRVHQDIVLSSQMFVPTAGTVVLLPAQTRYEQPGGGTETSTERRILFSPEIPGRRIGEARAEWQIFLDVARRTHPDRAGALGLEGAVEIREEIARAVPSYRGIETLSRAGDAIQWGGPRLCAGETFPTPDARAHFTSVALPGRDLPPGRFLLSMRRGKQFNSMVHGDYDPLTGARRDDVLIHPEDARALGLAEGDTVTLRSDAGTMDARVKCMPIQPRNLQVHWPEGNVLLLRGVCDPECGIPDYHAVVEIVRRAPDGR